MRSWWRHEQQSIRMPLATVSHHSFGKVDTAHDSPRSQKTVTRTEAAGTQYFSVDDEDLLAAGERPAAQEKVERHSANVMELLPLVGPVSLQGSALVDFFKRITVEPMVEQVTDVPKISYDLDGRRADGEANFSGRSRASCDCCKFTGAPSAALSSVAAASFARAR